LVAATSIIAYESVRKLLHPIPINEYTVIIVALIGILVNGGTAMLFMRGKDNDLNIKSAFLHLAYDAVISFGVVVAGVIILFTKALWIDPLVGLLIVLTILGGTWSLLRDSVNLILDAVPRHINYQGIKDYLSKIAGVTEIHDLHIWSLSTSEIALTAHLVMPERDLHDQDYQEINHDLEHKFKVNHTTIQVEKGTTENPCGQVKTC
jgi:cobalt-zinc-cadmium efflux system protein